MYTFVFVNYYAKLSKWLCSVQWSKFEVDFQHIFICAMGLPCLVKVLHTRVAVT